MHTFFHYVFYADCVNFAEECRIVATRMQASVTSQRGKHSRISTLPMIKLFSNIAVCVRQNREELYTNISVILFLLNGKFFSSSMRRDCKKSWSLCVFKALQLDV